MRALAFICFIALAGVLRELHRQFHEGGARSSGMAITTNSQLLCRQGSTSHPPRKSSCAIFWTSKARGLTARLLGLKALSCTDVGAICCRHVIRKTVQQHLALQALCNRNKQMISLCYTCGCPLVQLIDEARSRHTQQIVYNCGCHWLGIQRECERLLPSCAPRKSQNTREYD